MRTKVLLTLAVVLSFLPVLFLRAQGENPHGNLQIDCGDCHTRERWTPVASVPKFRHESTGFRLDEAHARVKCRDCHRSLVFNRVGTACIDCHKDAHRGELGSRCEVCHTAKSWTNQREMFQVHSRTRFPLFAVHANVDCGGCHKNQRPFEYANTPTQCASCHADSYAAATNPNHAQAGFPMQCEGCHKATTTSWKGATFRHDAFPIRGAHSLVECSRCHTAGYRGTPRDCVGCHRNNYTSTRNPNHVAGNFPTACDTCHRETAWRPATSVDHDRTRFPLRGAHLAVECARCHPGGQYAGTSNQCFSCHEARYRSTANPNHVSGNFSRQCDSCHSVAAWRPAALNHDQTAFPLTGAHRGVDCARCHVGGRYVGTPKQCYSCHEAKYRATTNPNHVAGRFATQCESCHNTTAWRPAALDHDRTRFPLTGAHRGTDCARCHPGGRYAGTPSDCWSCHQANYNATANPNHAQGNIPRTCEQCHNTGAWRPANFNHASVWPLTGAHGVAPCARCHPNGRYAGTPTDCWSCHQANYNATSNPNHAQGNIPHTCEQCHNTGAWRPANFNHASVWPLTGAHSATPCARCHPNGRYTGTPTDCWSCHQANYNGTSNPNHAQGNFPHTCEQCHTTGAWRPANFNHASVWPLTGAHSATPCARCHPNGRYTGTPRDCWSCHQANYNGTSNPNHAQGNFPHTCEQCHTTGAWRPANFNHASVWPLTGVHSTTPCAQCHPNGRYTGTPRDCWSCHQANYNGSTNPNHVQANFPHTCEQCHTTGGWRPATFNHNSVWPLTGAHSSTPCARCHPNGRYTGTPRDCWSCHQANYNGTTNPNHAQANFPHTCEQCHTTGAWRPATFDHDGPYFPIYSGKHRGKWNTCADCHVNSGNYRVFECILCHEHSNQTEMASKHQGVSGYRYVSTACYQCHPRGSKN